SGPKGRLAVPLERLLESRDVHRLQNTGVIDLRSDTKTQPSRGMREAMASAEVGDEQRREDPTVLDLERRVAHLLGQDESAYVRRVWPLEEIRELVATCRELGLTIHLDGARVLNAAVASGVQAAVIAEQFDTVTLCLSKGLGCPLGALVAGSHDLMRRARRFKHQFGGAMRQAGIVAAAGVYALDHNVERLAEDHARARQLAEGLQAAGVPVDLEQVETNFVQINVGALDLDASDALARLAAEG